MAQWERRIEIEAPPVRVWNVLADVASWPAWTESILSVEDVSEGFGQGGTATVHARGTPKSRYTVTAWEPGRGFDWETKARGARAIARHWIEGAGEGRSSVALTVEIPGPLAVLVKPFISRGIVANLETEAAGLKKRGEAER
jgi:hypothetical protein